MPWTAWVDRVFPSRSWTEAVFLALDLETSGLDPRGHCILSVGTIPVRKGTIRWGERYYSLVRPPDLENLPAEGIRAHHILPAELHDAPAIRTVLAEVDRRLQDAILLLHHSPLDVGFLREAYRRSAMPWPRPAIVDTERLAIAAHLRRHALDPHPPPPITALHRVRQQLGLPPHLRHHALADALATAELFLALRSRLELRTVRQLVHP